MNFIRFFKNLDAQMQKCYNCLWFIISTVVRFLNVKIGDILEMKKPHPCKGKNFLVLRSGMDFKLRCITCNHDFMSKRSKIEKNIKKIIRPEPNNLEE